MTDAGERFRPSHHVSPLRYPGGKSKLASYIKAVVRQNALMDGVYVEPFAGGAGVGLSLLLHGYVSRIVLNDLSGPIYSFWRSVVDQPDELQERILSAKLSVEEWLRQRSIFQSPDERSDLELGFAAFYLNRTNRSGVLNGGMIGGYAQTSEFGLDARFNRGELAARVARIARLKGRITILRQDAATLIEELSAGHDLNRTLVYLDPPYFRKGRDLYYDFYRSEDHAKLKERVASLPRDIAWVVSYDNEPEIRALYDAYACREYSLSYSVRNGRVGKELMFFSPGLTVPDLEAGGLAEANAGVGVDAA